MTPLEVGHRLQLFVDDAIIAEHRGTQLRLHHPQPQLLPRNPLTGGYVTVIRDGARFHGYYRDYLPGYDGPFDDGNPGEITCYAESADGHEWSRPALGLHTINGSAANNVILHGQAPFSHNFSPFLDTHPGADASARFKALAGIHAGGGLFAFASADGVRWRLMREQAVITSGDFAFDSQNVSFWSPLDNAYVCYCRTWRSAHGQLRTISRVTSPDFVHWSAPEALDPNLADEHLYTSQAHPYFREPAWIIALPTRFVPARGESTEILFMAARAGQPFARPFKEAFIRPGLDPARWGNRANYAALNVVATGPDEMSIYHAGSGVRYTLRTDGFVSINAGYAGGACVTQPLVCPGGPLMLNVSTSATGVAQVELQDAQGHALPGYSLDDCVPIVADAIAQPVTWAAGRTPDALAGRAIRLCIRLRDADVYAFQFGSHT